MRVLFTCLPAYGHFHALVPMARAVASAGHSVLFGTGAELCPRVDRAGFEAAAAGIGLRSQLQEAARRYPVVAALPPGAERFEAFVPRMLAGVAAPARANDLLAIVEDWRPDIIVHDEAELAGPLVAARFDIPHVTHSVGVLRPFGMARLAGDLLAPLYEEWGLEADPMARLFRYLYLDVCPPRLQSPAIAEVAVAHPLRPETFDAAPGESLPPWVGELPPLPTVYVSLGTVFSEDPSVFVAVLEALGDQPVNVIVTVGNDNDPARLGPQPAHIRVERYIPQSLLLGHCDLVVTHGAWSMFAALARGLPMLLLPQGANQFHMAEAAVGAGVARRLLRGQVDAASVAAEVADLLARKSWRDAAALVAAEIAAMPAPEAVVATLERLAADRQPMVGLSGTRG